MSEHKRLNLDERETIVIGILHRIFINGSYYAGNDCRYASGCNKRLWTGGQADRRIFKMTMKDLEGITPQIVEDYMNFKMERNLRQKGAGILK